MIVLSIIIADAETYFNVVVINVSLFETSSY